MNKENIEIFERRDFGEFISAPISFLVQEFKVLVKALFIYVGPFILVETILIYYFDFSYNSQAFSSLFEQYGTYRETSGFSFLLRILELFQSVMMYTVIGVYIKLYAERGRGNFELSEIWQMISKFYWPVMGGNIIGGIMIIVGVLALIIPGIYLAVVLSLLFIVIIFEEQGVGKSISRVFEVIKGNWWTAFGAYIVMGIMFFLSALLLQVIVESIFSIFGYGRFISASSSVVSDLIFLLISSVMTLLPVFLYSSFLTEKEDPLLMKRIKRISDDLSEVNIFEVKESDDQNITDDDESRLSDEDEQNNRFKDDNDIDRFKPKY